MEKPRYGCLDFGMELLTLSRDPWFCLVNGYLWYPNLGFCWDYFLTLEFLKVSLGKTLNRTRNT